MLVFATGWSRGFDGPGRRWVVHLKGCNLQCCWCANPEGISSEIQTRQMACGKTEAVGEELSVDQIVSRAARYRPLFGQQGGVTFSGGEPTLQSDELRHAVEALVAEGISVALETNGSTPCSVELAGQVDWMSADLKCASPERHQKWTGGDNLDILENLSEISRRQRELVIRVPLVVGLNDDPQEQDQMAGVLGELAAGREKLSVEIMRMHHLGVPKFREWGIECNVGELPVPTIQQAATMAERFSAEPGVEAEVVS